jgi:hypothetical protein
VYTACCLIAQEEIHCIKTNNCPLKQNVSSFEKAHGLLSSTDTVSRVYPSIWTTKAIGVTSHIF